MIDARGKALHANIAVLIELEEERFSDPLSEAMDLFNSYMNRLNGTKGVIYDKHGEVLMEC
jgi:alanyl-tRNA synthetase